MTVAELRKKLEGVPDDAEVGISMSFMRDDGRRETMSAVTSVRVAVINDPRFFVLSGKARE